MRSRVHGRPPSRRVRPSPSWRSGRRTDPRHPATSLGRSTPLVCRSHQRHERRRAPHGQDPHPGGRARAGAWTPLRRPALGGRRPSRPRGWVNSVSGLSCHCGAVCSGRHPGQVGQRSPDPVAHTTAPIATAKNVNSAARGRTPSGQPSTKGKRFLAWSMSWPSTAGCGCRPDTLRIR
jgi:hypothetical protein